MKVKLDDGRVYLIHWVTESLDASSSKNLSKTTCTVRTPHFEDSVYITDATVRQYINDRANNVLARKLSLAKALDKIFGGLINKDIRTSFWDEYKRTARVGPRTLRVKNCELRVKNEDLKTEVDDLEERLARLEQPCT